MNPKFLSAVLGFSMLFIGICGISYEYTFSKLASDIMGNSVRQWAIVIGLMMFFMGIGADLQKYLPDRYIVDQFIFLEILLGFLGVIGPTVVIFAFGEFHDQFIIVHYFFICSIGLLIGLEIPLLTRVNQRTAPSLKENLGMILKMDYVGSFIGALIWTFILPRFFNLLETSFVLGIINVLVAVITWFWFRGWLRYKRMIPLVAGIANVLLISGVSNGRKIQLSAEQKLYKDPIIYTETTPFQHIVLTQSRSNDLYLYINGHLQFSSIDEHIYHEFLVHPVMAGPRPKKRVLILGGGDGLAVREVLKYPSVESITLVDIDPGITNLARDLPELVRLNQNSLNGPLVSIVKSEGISEGEKRGLSLGGQGFFRRQKRVDDVEVSIVNIDAYQFVESISGIFDVIIIDFPDPNDISLSKLYSLEFYTHIRNRLAFDGVLIQQSTSPTFAKETFRLIGRTMQKAGYATVPIHHTVPSFGDWGWWIAGHAERFGRTGMRQQLESIEELPENVRYITPNLIKSSLHFGKDFFKDQGTEINTILEDKAFLNYQKAWKKMQ